MVWVTFVAAGITWLQAPVTIAVRFGPAVPSLFGSGAPVPAPATRLYPLQVVGVSVPLLPPAGLVRTASQPVVPGVWLPGAARSQMPQPKPTPVPSQLRKPLAAPALGVP